MGIGDWIVNEDGRAEGREAERSKERVSPVRKTYSEAAAAGRAEGRSQDDPRAKLG